ncbi:MAG: YCF48-related protein [Ignavibacteriaceae bacterium]|nr:YCF48-related protein [Ignavibacteriaceae bacterium]
MNKKLLSLFLSFLIVGFVTSFAQEEETEDIQAFVNPTYQQNNGFSVFDSQPIYNSPWEWLHQTPQGNTLRWVKMWDANNWYAVGYGGTFLKTTDGGATWFMNKTLWIDNTGGNEIIYDAYFSDMDNGLACGGYGTIVRTTDGGVTWDSVGVDGTTGATWYDMYFVNSTLGFVSGTTSGRLAVTTDGGATWTPNATIGSGTYYSVFAPDADTILVFSSSGNLQRSTDGGTTWNTINVGQSSTLYSNKFTDAMNGWVCGSGDNPAYTTDCGLTWTLAATSPTASTQYDIDVMSVGPMLPVNPQSVNYWTGTTNDTLKADTSEVRGLDTEDGWFVFDVSGVPDAATIDSIRFYGYVNATNWPYWSATPLPGLNPLTATAADLKTAIEANSGSGLAYIYSNESSSFAPGWHNYPMENTANADFQAALTQDWFAMGMDSRDDSPTYFINFDGWNQANVPYLVVYYTDGGVVQSIFITGDSFDNFMSTDMGTTWTPIAVTAPGQPWTSTHYSTDLLSPDNFVTVGAFGLINQVDGGTNTAFTNWIKAGTLYDVWADNPMGNVIACGAASSTTTFDQAIYSTDGGASWAVSTMMDSSDLDFNRVSMVSSTTGYAACEDYRIMKTTDGGATWFRVTDPVTSTSDAECLFFVDENVGYVFGVLDDGYKTTDGGNTWSVLTTGETSTFYNCYFTDANTGWVVGSSGTLIHTTDGGATFSPQDPNNTSTLYGITMLNNNVGYISGSSGRVRRTTDGGVTWDTVDVGYTGVTLYSVSFKDENNGMTGGSVGRTYYTTDGGTTWNFDNTGMSTIYEVYVEKSSTDTAAVYAVGTNSYVMKNFHTVVPVELASFSASVNGNNVTLSWMTATELNNSGFSVERKTGEESWTELGFIQGHGTTSETQVYTFIDKDLVSGIYNYRIKQIDFNGSYKFYDLKEEVDISAPNSYDLSQNYPNPFNPATKIKYSVPVEGLVNIAVFNILGEKVADLVNSVQKAGNYELTFNATNLASGMYIYRMESGNYVSIKKMMILK